MRRHLAGILCLFTISLCVASTARGQAKGEVESIGFNSYYRPNCWTPMVVRLSAEVSGDYQLQVVQEDLDRDKVVFTRTIAVTGADNGVSTDQRFWMYFIPQPTNHGLFDMNRGGTQRELQEQLKVFLCDAKGKQIALLPITTQTIINLEPQAPVFSNQRGRRLILSVAEGGAAPVTREYENALGVLEEPVFVGLTARDLPESAIGYEAVDTILWLNAPAPGNTPTEERRMRAIQQFVRRGGQLILCQPAQRDATLPWGDMLPVTVNDIVETPVPEPLRTIAIEGEGSHQARLADMRKQWDSARGPFRIARAEAKPGTIVDATFTLGADASGQGGHTFPFIVRMAYGLGSVTWVAQDLSERSLTPKLGWVHIWDKICDWRNETIVPDNRMPQAEKAPYSGGGMRDLGYSLRSGMELEGKSRAFVGLAVVFFLVYWLVAGPGLYIYLAARARSGLSWFLFAASAIVATALTVLVVQLVVRGPAELRHISIVRKAPGQPAEILSRFGLYIKHDGVQEISLTGTDPRADSYITAFAEHPEHVGDTGDAAPARLRYTVPIHEAGAGENVAVGIPFRSTLKKLQCRWVGDYASTIDGSAKVYATDYNSTIQGFISNGTGLRLKNIYVAYKPLQRSDPFQRDQVLYLPVWDNGVSLDLAKEFNPRTTKWIIDPANPGASNGASPDRGEPTYGWIYSEQSWPQYWYSPMRPSAGMDNPVWDDFNDNVPRSMPMLSLFSRLPPVKSVGTKSSRFEILRRGARRMDISQALSAGQLVVLAEAENVPVPMPLDINGERATGSGTTYYQFALPLEYVIVDDDNQQPGQAPTTAPAATQVEAGQS